MTFITNSNTTAKPNIGKIISLQKPPSVIPSGRSYLLVLSKCGGSPLPMQHLHNAAWFNINLPLDPQLKATAWKQN